jgi:SOS response regulatory protein OraA/RecX
LKERNLDKEAREENSSSQNVKLSILDIIERGAGNSKAELLLSNGSSFFITRKMVSQNNLKPGMFLSEQQAEGLKIRADYIICKKKALELLASREHSVNQLKLKLLQRKFTPDIINTVLPELQSEGALSNIRFMESWLSNRLRKHPEGSRSLLAGLLKAGISSEEAGAYLYTFLEYIDMDAILLKAAEKIMKKKNMTREKMIRSLKNRGFEFSAIIRFIEKYYPESSAI